MTLLEVHDLHVEFRSGGGLLGGPTQRVRAIDGVSLAVTAGTSLGIVGESGCGKSTLARAVCGLVSPTSGAIVFAGERLPNARTPAMARQVQIVFQDPTASLNPRRTVRQTLAELLRVHRLATGEAVEARCRELVELVELPTATLDAYPRGLSGGQRQRVGIARALAVEPQVLIADEAVSALDVSVQASVLALLADLRARLGLTLVLISHDLGVVRAVCDRVAVMYLGRIVEEAPVAALYDDPRHPYTRALLAAAPRLDAPRTPGAGVLSGDPPSPLELPVGCRFHPRCPLVVGACRTDEPALDGGAAPAAADRAAACWRAWEGSALGEPLA